MLTAGIDPGLSGAVALFDGCALAIVIDMPVLELVRGGKRRREVDAHLLADKIEGMMPAHAYVEQVAAMPGQGVSSVFAFGRAYGIVIGILAALDVPVTTVSPVKWKKALGVPAAKDGARARASELLPGSAHLWARKKDDGRAEAALIALWGSRQ